MKNFPISARYSEVLSYQIDDRGKAGNPKTLQDSFHRLHFEKEKEILRKIKTVVNRFASASIIVVSVVWAMFSFNS